jgi:hypothetical protein
LAAAGVTVNGDTTRAYRVDLVPTPAAGTNLILIDPTAIVYADDGDNRIDRSTVAALQMDSAPTNPADATAVLVSLWQHNLIGLKVEQTINWQRGRDEAVAYVEDADYGA